MVKNYIFTVGNYKNTEKQLRDNKEQKQLEKNPALLAVVANAYSNTQEVFDEHVNNTVFRMLGHQQVIKDCIIYKLKFSTAATTINAATGKMDTTRWPKN